MMQQEKILNEYYTNLNYDNNKEKALEKIYNLSETVRFHDDIHLPERLEILANIIQENISNFKSVCRHVDVIDTILEYLNNYAVEVTTSYDASSDSPENTMLFDMLCMILPTFFIICNETAIKSFLLYSICTNSFWDNNEINQKIENMLVSIGLETEIIILEDSDLNAVINYLIITDNSSLCKIWVQKQVEEKFLWLIKRHNSALFTIDTFQSLKDIPLRGHKFIINITSIWSEDIVAAKNLAQSLNSHTIFINSYMDFFGGIVLLPYKQIYSQVIRKLNLREICENEFTDLIDTEQNLIHVSHIAEMNNTSICNLFYDGTWQEPVKGMYWKHNNNLWANATNYDIIRCYESAEKGLKIWSMKSIQTRIQMLSKFVPILKLKGKLVLVAIIERCLKFPCLFACLRGWLSQDRMTEIMQMRTPIGIIILREENENVLFLRLILTLIAGNSIIVIFDANFCDLTPYCDMFSTCGIPPGVINLLSHEDARILAYKLCSENYTDYASRFLFKCNSKDTYMKQYLYLTIATGIILRLESFW